MSTTNHYDVIIIGTGAGGGTLAHRLALNEKMAGKQILVLERGAFLPKEKANWSTDAVFRDGRYQTDEAWADPAGNEIHPGVGYWVGGNTKVYGGALFRLREEDFDEVQLHEGISPAWPLKYDDYQGYYDQAEALYQVHGKQGDDPTEPPRNHDYTYPPVSHEPRIAWVDKALQKKGLQPFYLPLSVKLNEKDAFLSECIRCNTCDGFPCFIDAKSDADVNCIRPSMGRPNVSLITEAKVNRLHTSESGKEITGVEAEINGETQTFSGDIVVVACGAVNSAVLLLNSANEQHPNGLANSSDQVGRNFMKHLAAAVVGLSLKENHSVFQKTLAINDYYWGESGFEYPMGHVQLLGKVNSRMLALDVPKIAPRFALKIAAKRTVDWWLTGEDAPDANNRITVKNGKTTVRYEPNNMVAFKRLIKRWIQVIREVDSEGSVLPVSWYFSKILPVGAVAHQVGTCRFGTDPATSVLDVNCKAHDVDNLYVVDGSFFPSSAAVNPSLTIMANAMRVGDHLAERLG
ncbi:MAG: GMC family oxidoreductase [Cyanobacteria bacterium P01_F01_bin.53]